METYSNKPTQPVGSWKTLFLYRLAGRLQELVASIGSRSERAEELSGCLGSRRTPSAAAPSATVRGGGPETLTHND